MKNVKIFETFKSTSMQVNESEDGLIHMTGLFGETGTRNRNGRVYNKENYGEMIEALQPQVKVGLLGECEHPYSLSINLNNVSHRINELHMNEDGSCTGEISILNTPKGQILKALVEGGLPLFVSSRGAGTVDEDGNVTLTKLVTFDVVATPSVENARFDIKESLCESVDDSLYLIEDENQEQEEVVQEEVEQVEETIPTQEHLITKEEVEQYMKEQEETKEETKEEAKDEKKEDICTPYLDSLIEEIKNL